MISSINSTKNQRNGANNDKLKYDKCNNNHKYHCKRN